MAGRNIHFGTYLKRVVSSRGSLKTKILPLVSSVLITIGKLKSGRFPLYIIIIFTSSSLKKITG